LRLHCSDRARLITRLLGLLRLLLRLLGLLRLLLRLLGLPRLLLRLLGLLRLLLSLNDSRPTSTALPGDGLPVACGLLIDQRRRQVAVRG
jgi:hypothetical protein